MSSALRHLPKGLAVFLFVALTGPAIGAAIFSVFTVPTLVMSNFQKFDGVLPLFAEVGQTVLVLVVFAYLFGAVPALFCGALLGLWMAFGRSFSFVGATVLGVLSATALPIVIMIADGRLDLGLLASGATLFLALFGGVSAVIGVALMRRLGLR